MIPILYAKDAAAFNNNGKGHLKDAVSCKVTEERNGEYTCTLQYPLTGSRYSSITEGCIIKAKPNDTSDPQLFRIKKSSKPINGIVTFYANHISYDLSGLPLMGLTLTDSTASAAMTAAFAACPINHGFSAWSNKTALEDIDIPAPRSLRNFIGGQAGSILDLYGGELEFDNFTVKLHVSRGADNGVIIAYGKNLTDLKQERNIESCYTHLCPFAIKTVNTYNAAGEIVAQTEEAVTLTENVITLLNPENIGHSRALIIDLSDEFDDDEEINETNLRAKANAYIAAHELTAPEVNITVSFVQLHDTPEYKNIAVLERVKLCDSVTVRFSALGINAKAKVIKTEYDVLSERYTSIQLGSARASLADTVMQINGRLDDEKKTAKDNKNEAYADLNNAVVEATNKITGNSGGYIVLHPANNPTEILIMDTPDINTATKVWRWNSAGLGYSSTGYNGTYSTAITMDGEIVADFVKTGTLSAITVNGCTVQGGTLNIGSGKFAVDANGNAHAEGYIKAKSGDFGNSDHNFTIGANGDTASLYCGTNSLGGTGGLGITSNNVYIGTDGLSYTSPSANHGYATIIRSNIGIFRGKTTGDYCQIGIRGQEIAFYNSGNVDISTVQDATVYEIASIEMDPGANYVKLYGDWRSEYAITVVSDERAKNSISDLDGRYIALIDGLTPRRFRYRSDKTGTIHTGFIAQELDEAMKAAGLSGAELAALDKSGEAWGIRYEELLAPMLAKIKSLEARISALEAEREKEK